MEVENNHSTITLDQPAPGRSTAPEQSLRCSVRTVRTTDEFDAMEPQWSALVNSSNATIFQTFEWQRTWWKYFGNGSQLHCLIFTVGDRTVGIAPLFCRVVSLLGIPIARRLEFIGRTLSDYLEIIVHPGYENIVFDALAQHLISVADEWEIFDLEDVNETSHSLRLLSASLSRHGLPVYKYPGNVCPQFTLPPSTELLMQGNGSSAGYNYRRKLKRLQTNFKSTVELFRHEADDLEAGIDAFCTLHGDRWRSQGYPSAFDDQHHRDFHIEVIHKFARHDWLRMFFLKVDDRPVAVSFSFNYKGHIYMYQSNAHASEEVMKCSPGFLIRSMAIIEGIGEGMHTFDFMRGNEGYKYKEWKATDSQNWFIRTATPNLAGRIRFRLFLAFELLKKSADRAKREQYEFRRFCINEKPGFRKQISYIATHFRTLMGVGSEFILRHSPLLARISASYRSRTRRVQQNGSNEPPDGVHLGPLQGRIISRLRRYNINTMIYRLRKKRHKTIIVHETNSPLNGVVKVVDCGSERQLLLGGDTHSIIFTKGSWAEARREVWGRILKSPFPLPREPRVLLCGLGGGTMIHLLMKDFPNARATVLEIDPVVIETARMYFGIGNFPNVEIILGDALESIEVLAAERQQFDLIVDDAFYDLSGKKKDIHKEIVRPLFGELCPAGTIVLNRPIDKKEDELRVSQLLDEIRAEGNDVRFHSIRHRWWNDLIYYRRAG